MMNMNERDETARGIGALSRYRPRRTSTIRDALGECVNLLADGVLSEEQTRQFANRMHYAPEMDSRRRIPCVGGLLHG